MHVDNTIHSRIKARLHDAGSSFSEISREINRSVTTVITVSQGKCTSRPVAEAIASKLKTSPEKLWPQRYGKGEQP